MNSPLPAALLELKSSFDHWRSTRSHIREPIPDDLRHAAQDLSRQYSPALVARVLHLDPHRLKKSITKPTRPKSSSKKPHTAFFKLPTEVILPAASLRHTDCRVLLERPDGTRLTLTLPPLDLSEINTMVYPIRLTSLPPSDHCRHPLVRPPAPARPACNSKAGMPAGWPSLHPPSRLTSADNPNY